MKNNTEIKLKEAIANAEKLIEQMEKMDDKKLSLHLDLFEQQMQMAYKQNNEAAYKLLLEYERQTIIARVNKNFPSPDKDGALPKEKRRGSVSTRSSTTSQTKNSTGRMKKKIEDTLEELTSNREDNIQLLLTWSDDKIKEMLSRYREAKQIAYEENRMESYRILEEKISQMHEAQDIKFSLSDEASDWIHW